MVDPTVDFLAHLAGMGPALELGIDTGRIALLRRRGVPVHGFDCRHPLHVIVDGATKHQDVSSQVMDKITGTESSVAAKIVSRAKITPRS